MPLQPASISDKEFTTPIAREPLTGVDISDGIKCRYNVEPEGYDFLRIPFADLPEAFQQYLLGKAEEQERAKHATE